jgi:hypothetical protein
MSPRQRFIALVSALVTVIWVLAFAEGLSHTALICALLGTALSAALVLTTSANLRPPYRAAIPFGPRSDAAEFRRELAHLCAALKYGISFCERHPESDPDPLLQEVEAMGDAILAFVNQMARPVCLLQRTGCAADMYQLDATGP